MSSLRWFALSLLLFGCGASVSRFDGDVPEVIADTAVVVDTGLVRPDAGALPDVVTPADVGVRHDVPVPPVDVGPGPMCAFRGTNWDVDIGGMRAGFEFTADGRWVVSVDANVVASGVYALEGDRVVLSGEMSSSVTCAPTDRGTFQLRFSPDCEQLQLAIVHDDCAERGDGVDRFRLTRR